MRVAGILAVSFLLVLAVSQSGCVKRDTANTGTGAEADTDQPYVTSSFGYDSSSQSRMRTSVQHSTRSMGNSVEQGDFRYSVVETTSGFAVQKHDKHSLQVVERTDYYNMEPDTKSLASPRISNVTSSSFDITFTAIRPESTDMQSFRAFLSPLTISRL